MVVPLSDEKSVPRGSIKFEKVKPTIKFVSKANAT